MSKTYLALALCLGGQFPSKYVWYVWIDDYGGGAESKILVVLNLNTENFKACLQS